MSSYHNKSLKTLLEERLKPFAKYIFVAILALLTISVIQNIRRISNVEKRIETERQKLLKLQEENKNLKESIADVQSESYMEAQFRDKLGLSKEGESILVLPEEEIVRKMAPAYEEEKEPRPLSNWQKWVKLFL